jgi:hypothetical protein
MLESHIRSANEETHHIKAAKGSAGEIRIAGLRRDHREHNIRYVEETIKPERVNEMISICLISLYFLFDFRVPLSDNKTLDLP